MDAILLPLNDVAAHHEGPPPDSGGRPPDGADRHQTRRPRRRDRLGQHLPDGDAGTVGEPRQRRGTRCRRRDDVPRFMPDLDAHRAAADLDRAPEAIERPLGHRSLPQAESRDEREDPGAETGGSARIGQDGQGVRRPALLHHDGRQPCVRGTGGQQVLQDAGPDPRVEIVDVGLDQDRGTGMTAGAGQRPPRRPTPPARAAPAPCGPGSRAPRAPRWSGREDRGCLTRAMSSSARAGPPCLSALRETPRVIEECVV